VTKDSVIVDKKLAAVLTVETILWGSHKLSKEEIFQQGKKTLYKIVLILSLIPSDNKHTSMA
jgi:hypothetical protein